MLKVYGVLIFIFCFDCRIRLRKKSWKSPSTIYTDESLFERDIKVTVNAEFFIEIVDGKIIC